MSRPLPPRVAQMITDMAAQSDRELLLIGAGHHPSTIAAADRRGLIYLVPCGEHRLTTEGEDAARAIVAEAEVDDESTCADCLTSLDDPAEHCEECGACMGGYHAEGCASEDATDNGGNPDDDETDDDTPTEL